MGGPTRAFKYAVERRNVLGQGAFSMVMKGADSTTNQSVAIKKSRISSRIPRPTLEHEVRVMSLAKGHVSLPAFFGYLRDEHFEYIAMELLGPPVGRVVSIKAGVPPAATIIRIVQQVISALEHIHTLGIVHRDVKPSNILCSYDKIVPTVKLIDFGIAQRFSHAEPRRQDPLQHGLCVVGTVSYASINAHLGIELLPRDDLESLAYAAFDLLRGKLPWDRDRRAYSILREQEAIHKIKSVCSGATLGQGYPAELGSLLDYSRGLHFSAKPDYQRLIQSFTRLMARMGWSSSGPLDWTPSQPLNPGPTIPEPDVSHLPEEDPDDEETSAERLRNSYHGPDFLWWERANDSRRTECTLPPSVCAALDASIPQISVEMILSNPADLMC